jgi:hypothetical protein
MSDLLSAVDALTRSEIEHLAQRTDSGRWVKTVTIEHPALLVQLADAGSGRTSAGSNKAAHERAPIDMEAAYLHAQYTSQVADWCRMVNVKPTRNIIRDLRAWYAATLAVRGFDGTGYRAILTAWARTIRTHFDPPKKFEADHPCPVCGGSEHGNEFDGGATKAIEVTYRLDDTGRPVGERAVCRLCRAAWEGSDAVRELADEMREKREETTMTTNQPNGDQR